MVEQTTAIKKETLSEERKRLQEEGELPSWFSTGSWQLFKSKYLWGVDTPRQQYRRIAAAAAQHMRINIAEWEDKFFNLLWNGWLSPSTPVLSNMGTDRALPVSCAGSYIPDSIDGIYSKRHTTAMLTKMGFGTAGYLGDVRPRGAPIHGGGKSVGVLPVMRSFWDDMTYVAQGSARRGSWAGYLPIDHDDFDEVVDFLIAEPNGVNIGWNVSNAFLEKLLNGDDEANRRYGRAMRAKMTTGKGYWFFPDKANAKRPMSYVKHNLDVKAPQLCLRGDTNVLVSSYPDGRHPFTMRIDAIAASFQFYDDFELYALSYNTDLEIDEWRQVTSGAVTGIVNELTEVGTSSGCRVPSTGDHKFYDAGSNTTIEANSIRLGDLLITPDDEDVVTSINTIDCDDEIPVYDITVEGNHNFYANGILVSNCNEIMLHSSEDYDYTCVLASMNASRYDEWKDTDAVFVATVFLDCVVSEFLDKAKNGLRGEGPIPGLEQAIASTEKGRAIGLGVMGYHTYMLDHGIQFDGIDGHMFNVKLFKQLRSQSDEATKWLAVVFGEPEWCQGEGVRNTHRLACAPTKSTSVMMGGVSEGIGPVQSLVFTQRTPAGEISRIDPSFLRLMKEKGVYNDETVADIREHGGSCQHVDWLTSKEKAVFRNAFEINQYMIVEEAAARGKYIDQWQSLNLFFDADADEETISGVHEAAFSNPDILGLYYAITSRSSMGVTNNTNPNEPEECEACQ